MEFPKYTLEYDAKSVEFPYLIMEHAISEGGIMSREYCRDSHMETALRMLGRLSDGNILLAGSMMLAERSVTI